VGEDGYLAQSTTKLSCSPPCQDATFLPGKLLTLAYPAPHLNSHPNSLPYFIPVSTQRRAGVEVDEKTNDPASDSEAAR
jgi:hypothetical protein